MGERMDGSLVTAGVDGDMSFWLHWMCEVAGEPDAAELMSRIEHAEALLTQTQLAQARDMQQLRDVRLRQQAEDLGSDPPAGPRWAARDEDAWVANEIGVAVGLSPMQVRQRLDWVAGLDRYPHVDLLAIDGAAPAWTIQRLVDHLDELGRLVPPDQLGAVEAATVHWLREGPRTVTQLNRRMRRLVLRAKASAGLTDEDDAARSHAERDVRVRSRGDGTAELWALLPEPDALGVAAAIQAAAQADIRGPGEVVRTAAQRRADVLVARVLGRPSTYGCNADLPVDRPVAAAAGAARIDVTVPVRTLTGAGHAPGDCTGYGLVPSVTARDLATAPGTTFRGLLFDADTGLLVGLAPDLGAVHWVRDSRPGTSYQHPPVMDSLARARDQRCRAPGCGRAAARCDCDHVRAWPRGETSLANTCCLCRYHHRLKTHAARWDVDRTSDDDLTWVTPSGRRVTTAPHDFRDDDPPPF